MSNKINAPYTEEQVLKLKAWQEGNVHFKTDIGGVMVNVPPHPFTCCSHNGCERGAREDQGILIPSVLGWTCPCGAYKQYWCHDFMVEEHEQQTNNMIDKIFPLAVSKGWDGQRTFDTTEPDSAEADYLVYCQIHRWLMQKHCIYIAVMPWQRNAFSMGVIMRRPGMKNVEHLTLGSHTDYDSCFADAIEAALKLIPDGENLG